MTTQAHAARARRHPITADLVYGYEVITRHRHDPAGYLAALYAVTVDGLVFECRTTDPDTFNGPGAQWRATASLPSAAGYVGTYAAPPATS